MVTVHTPAIERLSTNGAPGSGWFLANYVQLRIKDLEDVAQPGPIDMCIQTSPRTFSQRGSQYHGILESVA